MVNMFLLLALALLGAVNGELVLTTSPDAILPGVSRDMRVRCALGQDSDEVNRVMVMQIEKVNGIHIRPLASMTTGEAARLDTQYPHNKANVTGYLSGDYPRDSFLELEIMDPNDEDGGKYLCVMSVLDQSFLLERKQVEGTVNVTAVESEAASALVIQQLRYLEEKIAQVSTRCQVSCAGAGSTSGHGSGTSSSGNAGTGGARQTQVAFTAFPANRRDFSQGRLLFDASSMNVGDGYNPATSTFTAPVNGTYIFMASVSTNDFKTISEIKRNGATVAQLATVNDDQTSSSVILHLGTGDRVWMEGVYESNNATLYADKDSLFSGFLLYED